MSATSNEIAETVLNWFNQYNKKKIKENEWSVLSGIVMKCPNGKLVLISAATGNKCIGANKICKEGYHLNDCHAEILARRCFKRYLYLQLYEVLYYELNDKRWENSILERSFTSKSNLYQVKEGYSFHLYISESPCGDASIYKVNLKDQKEQQKDQKEQQKDQKEQQKDQKEQQKEQKEQQKDQKEQQKDQKEQQKDQKEQQKEQKEQQKDQKEQQKEQKEQQKDQKEQQKEQKEQQKEQKEQKEQQNFFKRSRINFLGNYYIRKTGAKSSSSKESNQEVGKLRTKSGRSDLLSSNVTLSMSCSDKIAKWNILGIQGSLLSLWLNKPIYLSSLVIGEDLNSINNSMINALERALYKRIENISPLYSYKVNIPKIQLTSKQFIRNRQTRKDLILSPSGLAINWCLVSNFIERESSNLLNNSSTEVLIAAYGIKQGSIRKDKSSKKTSSRLCKRNLFSLFYLLEKKIRRTDYLKRTYEQVKAEAFEYKQTKDKLRETEFQEWKTYSDHQQFINIDEEEEEKKSK